MNFNVKDLKMFLLSCRGMILNLILKIGHREISDDLFSTVFSS